MTFLFDVLVGLVFQLAGELVFLACIASLLFCWSLLFKRKCDDACQNEVTDADHEAQKNISIESSQLNRREHAHRIPVEIEKIEPAIKFSKNFSFALRLFSKTKDAISTMEELARYVFQRNFSIKYASMELALKWDKAKQMAIAQSTGDVNLRMIKNFCQFIF